MTIVLRISGLIGTFPVLFLLCTLTVRAQNSSGKYQSIVDFRVNTSYDDSQASLDQLVQVIRYVPPRVTSLNTGETLSSLFVREYGFGPDDGIPRTYELIQQTVLWLNGLKSASDVRPGQILIPSIPRRALTQPNPHKGLNKVPKVLDFLSALIAPLKKNEKAKIESGKQPLGLKANIPDLEIIGEPQVSDANRLASQSAWISVPFDQNRLSGWLKLPGFVGISRVVNYQMNVELASAQVNPFPFSSENSNLLSDLDRRLIVESLKHRSRAVILFILDTGWPSAQTYRSSRETMIEVLNAIWKSRIKAKPPKRPSPQAFVPPSNGHCELVREALSEFTDLDQENGIRIVYVPLTKEQDAAGLLVEMIEVNRLILLMESRLGQDSPHSKDVKQYQQQATAIVKQLPNSWPASQSAVVTDKAILEAILGVANEYARLSGSATFVNESWTTPAAEYPVYYPDSFMGAVVAAAGNDGQNIDLMGREFAHRSLTAKDTVAVMNMNSQGIVQCNSAVIDTQQLSQHLMSTGYDGTLGGKCYTSFAAPRLAWLLALAESIRLEKVQSNLWVSWFGSLFTRMHPNPTQISDFRLDVSRLLSLAGDSP